MLLSARGAFFAASAQHNGGHWSDQGLAPTISSVSRLQTFGDLIDLKTANMCEAGTPPRRSKAATLNTLKRDLGKSNIGHPEQQKPIDCGRGRSMLGEAPNLQVHPVNRFGRLLGRLWVAAPCP